MLYCVLQVFIIDSNCDIAFELVLGGHVDSSPPVPGMVALATCLFSFFFFFISFLFILAVKKDANSFANSLHTLVDTCSQVTGTGGFFKVADWSCALS